jgi:hypothetical protein
LMGLPRADKSLNEKQKNMIRQVSESGKRVILFTHFTLINYELTHPIGHQTFKFAASDAVFNDFTKGTFSLGRDWFYPKINNGIHFTMAGHSHRSGIYRLDNANPAAMSAVGYQPAAYKRTDSTATKMHAQMFASPATTRVGVSSCSGPIGMQNLKGEMFGWNLMPPSGTLLDIDADGPLEFQRIVPKKYMPAKPRFCVALDYVQVHTKNMVIAWFPDMSGNHFMVVCSVLDAKDFISKVTFFVWSEERKVFKKFDCRFSPSVAGQIEFPFYFDNPKEFIEIAVGKRESRRTPIIFAQIDFNNSLSDHPLYHQYNFDDPWIIKVDATILSPGMAPNIMVAAPLVAQTPDWEWLSRVDPSRYPKPTSIKS